MITARWTGKFPCLCHGEWIIERDGKKIELPEDLRCSSMNTYGEYRSWHFDAGWHEYWDQYTDGLTFEPWLKENEWVADLHLTPEEQLELYEAIAMEDWRHGECGGCI